MDAIDMRQFLVSLSRGRESPRMFTDDLEMLAEYVARERDPMSVGDMFEPEPELGHGISAQLGTWANPPQPEREDLSKQLGRHDAEMLENSATVPLSERLGRHPTNELTVQQLEALEQAEEIERKMQKAMSLGMSV